MSIMHLLEDFGESLPGTEVIMTDVMIEEQKLDSFEKGYQAGWDDSVKARQDSTARISEDFAQSIQDLSFTYQEAYSGFIAQMEPLIRQIVGSVLPKVAMDTLGLRIADMLQQQVATHGEQPVRIVSAPGSADALRGLLPEGAAMPLDIEEDDTLAAGQVHIRFGDQAEREIDLQDVLDGIGTAVDAFFQDASQTLKETA